MRLHERDTELEAVERLLDDVARHGDRQEGGVLLVEGPAGIGKSALLGAARERAGDRDLRVLTATAAALDRDFPFGLVHQLVDPVLMAAGPEDRERLLAGAAGHAEPALSPGGAPSAGDEPGHAALHGLYWLLANLAEQQPLVLLAEDLHWADRPSLRLLEYAGRRLDGVALAVVATVRTGEPGADVELLEALAGGPRAVSLRPAPLSPAGSRAVVAEALHRNPEDAFAAACAAATGGNPLLLRAVATEAARAGLRGEAGDADRIAELGAGGVRRVAQRRLSTLGEDAAALAGAAAVLGPRARLDDLAAIAGLDGERARAAAGRLVDAELLEAHRWGFVHPVVGEAIADGLAPTRRAALHAAAAARLRDAGARAEEVAVHLLATEPAGDPATVGTLREAARSAAAAGAPEAGVAHLRRA
ncbi:MAG TPA: AAA family ATPase, partial [Baekduia sp.]|nr:AAA family ATPase [Baekduia sp.]